jgi:hypothetical protein
MKSSLHITRFASIMGVIAFFFRVSSQTYSVAALPDSLKDNAHCVIRVLFDEIEIKSVGGKNEKITKALTILDQEGVAPASLALYYDRNSSIKIDKITFFDRNGNRIKKVKRSEIKDVPAYESFDLFSDYRMKFFKPDYAEYPFTVEYVYEKKSIDDLCGVCWSPLNDYNVSAQQCRLAVSHPRTIELRSKSIGAFRVAGDGPGSLAHETWGIDNACALEEEPFSTSLTERVPCVWAMPREIVYEGHRGNAATWQELGKWVEGLFKGRDVLPDALQSRIATLVAAIPDTLERMKALYNYLQNHTRYVSVQLGIGRYQPFDAITVFETGYGDCKALCNYMHAMLNHIGIPSYPALVASGPHAGPILRDFPNFHQFDHVILCIPFHADTLWLECTNQKAPFGFLGCFTDDRTALVITDKGGAFAHTRKYGARENIRNCNARFIIDTNAAARCCTVTRYAGLYFNDIVEFLFLHDDGRKNWLYQTSALPSLEITGFSVTADKNIPYAIVNESSISRHYCSLSGAYMLVPLNAINAQKPVRKMLNRRISDVLIGRSLTNKDTSHFRIPTGYALESAVQGAVIHSKFGDYGFSVAVAGNEIIYTRNLTLRQGRYSPTEYTEFQQFIESVSKADGAVMILKKI